MTIDRSTARWIAIYCHAGPIHLPNLANMPIFSGHWCILAHLPDKLGIDRGNDCYGDALHLHRVGVRQVAWWPLAGKGSPLCSLHCGLVVFDSAIVIEPRTQQLKMILNADEAMINEGLFFHVLSRFVWIPCPFLSSQSALKDFDFMIALTEQAVLDNLFSIAFDRRVSSFVLQSFVAGSSDARCLLVIPSFMQQCSFAFVYWISLGKP